MAEIEAAAREAGDRLAMFFLETPANPTNLMTDIRAVADLAATRARRPLVFVDNTFLGPVFQRPLDHGADLVIYSATKYIGGHSDVVAGAVVGSRALVDTIFTYRTIMGTVPDPFSCWLLMRSLETLKLRMNAQATSACKIAHALVEHPAVVRVYHPALLAEDDPQRAIYEKQALGPGAVVAFDIAGGKAEAFRFLNAVKLCKLAVSLGGTESLVEHPATMTHSDIPCELRERFGIGDGLVRLSVGVEHPDDILADLFQALEAVV
jgi:methionine-gamma-lyase